MLNSFVDKIFVITTINSDRFNHIKHHLDEMYLNYEFVVSPEPTILSDKIKVIDSGLGDVRPSISLLSVYKSILEKSKLHNFKSICVIEDDCFFISDWVEKFNLFYNNIPTDWDILNLGYHPSHDFLAVKEVINSYVCIPKSNYHTTHCIMIKNICFKTIIENINYNIPIDYVFNLLYQDDKYKCYVPLEKIVYQLSIRKDQDYNIPNATVRFKSYINL